MASKDNSKAATLMDQAGNPIFNVERKGSMVKWMNDDGTTGAASKTEFSRQFKTESEWVEFESSTTKEALETMDTSTTDSSITPEETPEEVKEAPKETHTQDTQDTQDIQAAPAADTDDITGVVNHVYNVFLEEPGHFNTVQISSKSDYTDTNAPVFARKSFTSYATLVHELVHIKHLRLGIKDTCGGGAYHNDIFKNEALTAGLDMTEKTPGQGWGKTVASNRLTQITANWKPLDQFLPNEPVKAPRDGDKESKVFTPELAAKLKAHKEAKKQELIDLKNRVQALEETVSALKAQLAMD